MGNGEASDRIAHACSEIRVTLEGGPAVLLVGPPRLTSDELDRLARKGAVVVIAPDIDVVRAWLSSEGGREGTDSRDANLICVSDLEVDLAEHRVRWQGHPLAMSHTELLLLAVLGEKPGRAYSFDELAIKVWEDSLFGDNTAIRSAIKRLRRKLIKGEVDVTIDSVRGIGFRLVPGPSESRTSARAHSDLELQDSIPEDNSRHSLRLHHHQAVAAARTRPQDIDVL